MKIRFLPPGLLLCAAFSIFLNLPQSFAQRWDEPGFNWLKGFGEPGLEELRKSSTIHVYRFYDINSFTPSYLIRLDIAPSGEGALRLLYFPKRKSNMLRVLNRPVSKAEVKDFLTLVEANQFWTIPHSNGKMSGEDGWTWTLEGAWNGKTHRVERWCPKKGSATAQLCLYLKHLAEDIHPSDWTVPEYP